MTPPTPSSAPRLLTVSGSLREGSSNTALLEAVALLSPPTARVTRYRELASLPAFNPDLEEGAAPVPDAVARWRESLAAADAVLFSSPEYAHGVPGVLKNALDWVVGSGELLGKPVGLLSASAASAFAHPQLVEILRVMTADLVPDAVRVIDIPRRGADAHTLAADGAIAAALRAIVDALVARAGDASG